MAATQNFWSEFQSRYWERSELSQIPARRIFVPFTKRELFRAVVSALALGERNNFEGMPRPRFLVNGERMRLNGSALNFLPRESDRSFDAYNERIMATKGLKTYALVINHLFEHDQRSWMQLCERLQPLFRTFGVPFNAIESFLFLGNYEKTPFGVHLDNAGTFHFPIHGRKQLRLWSPEYVKKHPILENAKDYGDHLEASTLVHADPGKALYWPSDRWHIAEGDGAFSASWGFAYYINNGVHSATRDIYAKRMLEARETRKSSVRIGDLRPDLVVDEIRKYRLDLDTKTQEFATQKWLEHVSAFGFKPLFDLSQAPTRSIRSTDTFPVYSRKDGKKVIVACAGRSFVTKASPELTALLARLQSGRSLTLPTRRPSPRNLRDELAWKLADIIPQPFEKGSRRGEAG
jgi:hypothetical protein